MRLPIISPDMYTDVQRSLAVDMKEGIARSFQGFVNIRDDGALLGAGIRQAGLGIDQGDGIQCCRLRSEKSQFS
jgi:hypothetical protein